MTPEGWQRIGELLDELEGLGGEPRARRLAALREDEPALHAEVASLLAAAADAERERFLDDPPAVPLALLADGPAPGDRVGPYQLLEELGHGGMGTVHRARRVDGAFDKEVAVKLVRRGMDTELVVRRFLAERAILAGLDHPGIARLLDGGQTDDGRPYFVMELVGGRPLDRWLEERRPSRRRRLEVFLALCDAVQRAHRSLVIHRDLKPANVLVDDEDEPKLLDFGIARLLVPGGDVTRDDERLATPAYASPEQLRGEPVTTSTDVHGLGVLLFFLLTGRPPFTGEGAALVRAICDEPPPRPSAVATHDRAALRGDLDTIVAVALRKEPERRYASVGELAADVRRHLDGRPVLARGDGLAYRGGRFVRRHWLPVAAAAAVVIALAAGLVSTRQQAAAARRERARAEHRLVQVRGLAAALVFEVDGAIADLAGATPARRLVIERALTYLDELAAEAGDAADVARELVVGYRKLGDVQGSPAHSNVGDVDGAAASYVKAQRIAERWVARRPREAEARFELAAVLGRRSALRWAADDLAGAEALDGQALVILAPLPDTPGVALERAAVLANLGDARLGQGRRDEALASYREALRLSQQAAAAGETAGRRALTSTWIKVGDALRAGDDLGGAEAAYGEALRLREARTREAPDDAGARRDLSSALSKLVKVHKKRGDHVAALALVERARGLDEAALAADPTDARARRDLAATLLDAAQLEDTIGEASPPGAARRARWLAARAHFERALGLFTALVEDGGAVGSDAAMPDGIRKRLAALDAALATEPSPR